MRLKRCWVANLDSRKKYNTLCWSHSLAWSFASTLEGWSWGSKASADGSVLCLKWMPKRQQRESERWKEATKSGTSPVFSSEIRLQKGWELRDPG